jgi:phage terminase large subunit-like protein
MVIYFLTKPEWVPALIYFPRNKNDDDDDDADAIIKFREMCNQQNLCDIPPRNL